MVSEQDKKHLRATLGKFATGVTIISAHYQGQDYGLTVNSFSSVSLSPPLVLWSLQNSSINYQALTHCEYFAVNILSQEQQELSLNFSRPVEDRFAGVDCHRRQGQTPVLDGNLADLMCRTVDRLVHGDHTILLGEIIHAETNQPERKPLIYYDGQFRSV